MKTILITGLIVMAALLIGCATQAPTPAPAQQTPVQDQTPEEVVYIAFDFDTDQSITPFRDYGAAYIINVSSQTISIPIFTWDNTTMFEYFFYDERGIYPIFTEMMLPRINRNNFIILQPGDRVLAFSVAFFHLNLERFPNAMYGLMIIVNNNPIEIRGHFNR